MKTPLFFAIANPSPAIIIALLASLALLAAGVLILRTDRENRRLRVRLADLEAPADLSEELDLPVPLDEDSGSFSRSPEVVALQAALQSRNNARQH